MFVRKDKRGLRYQDSQWGAGYTLTTPIPSDPPLSEEELLARETPFAALILWSGGNGPHKYQVTKLTTPQFLAQMFGNGNWGRDQLGGIYIQTCSSTNCRGECPSLDCYLKYSGRVYIGRERYSTKVWALEVAE